MAGTYGLSPTYPDAAEADREMDNLISKFHDDVQAWKTKHANGGSREAAEQVWEAVCKRFGAIAVYDLSPQPVKKPASAIGDDPPPRPAPPQKSAAPAALALLWNLLGNYRWGKVVFAVLFVAGATFYFKDQRLAEEAKKKGEEPAAPAYVEPKKVVDPDEPPAGWEKMTDEELAKLGFKRVTRDEFDRMVLPGSVVVPRGRQDLPGYRVAYVEGEYAFLEYMADQGHYTSAPVADLERKQVPMEMPPPAPEPAPEPKPVPPKGPTVRPKPKVLP